VALALFRTQLSSLLGRVTEASVLGASLKLARSAERAADVSGALPELDRPGAASAAATDRPRTSLGRMTLEWDELAAAARALRERTGLHGSGSVAGTLGEARELGAISSEAAALARDLEAIRDGVMQAPRGSAVTTSTVDDFIEATRRLTAAVHASMGEGPVR
jgi:hypothetical protein